MKFAITYEHTSLPSRLTDSVESYNEFSNDEVISHLDSLNIDYTNDEDDEWQYLSEESGFTDTDKIIFQCRENDDPEFVPSSQPFWLKWKFAKTVTVSTILSKEDFETFISTFYLQAEDTQTLGTLGGPANPIGLAPDISFVEPDSQYSITTCRVTPLPEINDWDKFSEERLEFWWEKIRQATINLYE